MAKKTAEDVWIQIIKLTKPSEGGCIEWVGRTHTGGRGVVSFNGRRLFAYRFIMEQKLGRRLCSKNEFVCHHCDNPKCVNPDHLFIGDSSANLQDASRKGLLWTQKFAGTKRLSDNAKRIWETRKGPNCPKGHPREKYERTRANGHKMCWACMKIINVKRRLKKGSRMYPHSIEFFKEVGEPIPQEALNHYQAQRGKANE